MSLRSKLSIWKSFSIRQDASSTPTLRRWARTMKRPSRQMDRQRISSAAWTTATFQPDGFRLSIPRKPTNRREQKSRHTNERSRKTPLISRRIDPANRRDVTRMAARAARRCWTHVLRRPLRLLRSAGRRSFVAPVSGGHETRSRITWRFHSRLVPTQWSPSSSSSLFRCVPLEVLLRWPISFFFLVSASRRAKWSHKCHQRWPPKLVGRSP